TAQIYDRSGRRVATIAMHTARWAATATRLSNGDVLVLGGMTAVGATRAAELYEPSTGAFRELAPMRFARAGHTATPLPDGRVLIAAGERAPGRYVSVTELYDPRTGRSMPTATGARRIFQTALLIDNGSVLMFGGRNNRRNVKCAIIFDPARNNYLDAGEPVSAGASTLVFKSPTGRLITHRIRSA
ncbi:MAG TPA: kelch repeat-containing protein, partial [Candidatus Baltobacteraceae bacterium]|nr:kelch repeat-containing protein [Candidatus Baltobacteraceae bacterium]